MTQEERQGRYPFRHASNEYLQAHYGLMATSTYDERSRRYRRMAKDIEGLFEDGRITSPDPAKFTPEDIKEFYLLLKSRKLSQNGIAHEITALKSICLFRENNAVDVCREKYPIMKGRLPTFRLNTTPRHTFYTIIDTGNKYEDSYQHLRNFAVVLFPYCAGLRPVEMQHARIENLDLDTGTIYVDVVKGQGSYGEPRHIPILPEFMGILRKFVKVRNARFGGTGYLFPNPDGKPLSTNSLRKYKDAVQKAVSYEFDFREGRRTFGQILVDAGASVEDVAVIMGHRTSRTTENYYARRTQQSAVANVFNILERRTEKNE